MEKNTKKETIKGCLPTLGCICRWKSRTTKKEELADPEGNSPLQSNDKSHDTALIDDENWRKLPLVSFENPKCAKQPQRTTMANRFNKVKTFDLREIQSNSNSSKSDAKDNYLPQAFQSKEEK
ncbi:hypothetical protein Bca4012_011442 [Brassica carinata]|uniref:Uncharacterized protein n=1 Tax=Brassica carinata TaxID=52824 RepID=A0A8X7V2J4_BRACI|nr:hypothetical protein Bca52824_036336 [Brassica carinata]